VVAVVGFDPLVVAGGHSFETDLIEIAGGRSATHEDEAPRQSLTADAFVAIAPDLLLLVDEAAAGVDPEVLRRGLPEGVEVARFPFSRDFWLDEDPAEPARRLRVVVEPIAARASR
jgi:hypothetical protein